MDIVEKARQLGEALCNSEEYKTLKEKELQADNDEEAARLINAYEQGKSEILEMMGAHHMDAESMARVSETMRNLQLQMRSCESIASLHDAQRAFSRLMYMVNNIISFYTDEDLDGANNMEGHPSCGEEGCSACKGCRLN